MTDTNELAELLARFGSAKRPGRDRVHQAPGVNHATVEAIGKLSAAVETAEAARGHLYAFHRLSGSTDLELQDAVKALRSAGHGDVADVVDEVLVGRDIVDDMWSFQIVEKYDEQYWSVLRSVELAARRAVGIAPPHVHEAGMRADEQS